MKLVIDASVIASAGGRKATQKESVCCTTFLGCVFESDHIFVWTNEIMVEWLRHSSNFGFAWQAKMIKHKRFCQPNVTKRNELRALVVDAANCPGAASVMLKDVHLVEAALATDKFVASLDEKVRGHFIRTSREIDLFEEVYWANPCREESEVLAFVADGSPRSNWRLCSE